MHQKIRKAAALSRSDWATLLQASLWLLLVDVGLRTLGFARLRAILSPKAPSRNSTQLTVPEMQRVKRAGYLVNVAAQHHLYPMSCLTRSLVLQRLLAQRGVRADLRIGVRKEDGRLMAHAWLEHAGQPVGDVHDAEAPFVPLESGLEI